MSLTLLLRRSAALPLALPMALLIKLLITLLITLMTALPLAAAAAPAVAATPAGPAPSGELPRRTQLGVGIAPLNDDDRRQPALAEAPTSALKITAVSPAFTAARAGLRPGDVLLRINGEPLQPATQMASWVAQQTVGGDARFELIRDGRPMTLSARWIERPREPDNDSYRVRYEQVLSRGARLRTIVTLPATLKPGERAPAMLFIPGVSIGSLDASLEGASPYLQIVRSFARRGFVTMRVELPGIGDSDGGPAIAVDFERQADIYAQGLRALAARPDVDPARLLVFGHSMGGLWAPLAAADTPVKAVVVGGTVFRSWYEYVLENTRRQTLLAGTPPADVDDLMRRVAFVQQRYLHERLAPEAIAQLDPTLQPMIAEAFTPPGQHMGRVHAFWHQVAALNLPRAWERVISRPGTSLLVFWGTSEFVAAEQDHTLLRDFANRLRPGSAEYVSLPNTDHGFTDQPTPAQSQAQWGQPGTRFNPAVLDAVQGWLARTGF
jgi:hypothetical protein